MVGVIVVLLYFSEGSETEKEMERMFLNLSVSDLSTPRYDGVRRGLIRPTNLGTERRLLMLLL